jgi:hypothetical protein
MLLTGLFVRNVPRSFSRRLKKVQPGLTDMAQQHLQIFL